MKRDIGTIVGLYPIYRHSVQLKGVGFANNYPIPSHREGGDIDIFTYSADSSGLSDREANSLADKLMRGRGIEVDFSHSQKHSMFYYKGIPIPYGCFDGYFVAETSPSPADSA